MNMKVETLTSSKNHRVQFWRSLKEKKARQDHGLFLVEGTRMVHEALTSSFEVDALLVREGEAIPENLPSQSSVFILSHHVFDSVCDTRTPQGLAAVVRIRVCYLSGHRLVALDGVRDPGNVGTILRTADAAGMDGLLLSPDCADVFSPKVLRSTMGSIFRIGLSFPENLADALVFLRSQGFSILSSQLDGSSFFTREKMASSFVLVIGNEGSGVSPEVRDIATHRLALPMRGGAESLNAAVAAGIMMYDLMRELP